jgi:hypothetical protein
VHREATFVVNQDVKETVKDILVQLIVIIAALTAGGICLYFIQLLVFVVFREVLSVLLPLTSALIAWLITLVLPLTKQQKAVAILAFSLPAIMSSLLVGLG